MEEANAMAQHQMMLQQQPQQQQLMLLHQQYQQQQQQAAAISRFPSNIDAHLRTPGLLRQPIHHLHPQQQQQQSQQQQQHQQTAHLSRPGSQAEIEMAQQDAWRVCHPDVKRPFPSLEDACESLF